MVIPASRDGDKMILVQVENDGAYGAYVDPRVFEKMDPAKFGIGPSFALCLLSRRTRRSYTFKARFEVQEGGKVQAVRHLVRRAFAGDSGCGDGWKSGGVGSAVRGGWSMAESLIRKTVKMLGAECT